MQRDFSNSYPPRKVGDPRTGRVFERMPSVDIDRGALKRNWVTLDALHPNARTGAAVKADGYGLGAALVSRALYEAGCRDFFVAWPEEGIAVRRALHGHGDEAVRVFVLQGIEPAAVAPCVEHSLIPVLSNLDDLSIWTHGLARLGKHALAALQFETGMNRLGFDERELDRAIKTIAETNLEIALVLSHLASADESTDDTVEQHRRFVRMAEQFPGVPRSLANSAGIVRGQTFGFELTRPGVALYGGQACLRNAVKIEPVARLTAAVLQIREAGEGEKAGYGGGALLMRPTRIATVGLGYGDGYPRAMSGQGVPLRDTVCGPSAFLAGHRVPVLGRVSMDLTLLDITDLPENAVKPGDRAEFFGPNIPIDAVAHSAGTIAYELLTGLGPRVFRSWR